MKILQVITLSELGGAQTVVANLANTLCEEHDVVVAAGEGNGKIWDILCDKVEKVQLRHLQRTISPIKELMAIVELRRLYKKYSPDVIHLHSSKAGMLGRIAFPKSKIVYTVHGFDSIRIAYRKFLPIEKIMQNRCAAIVGVSEYDRLNLIKEGITNGVCTVYNGIKVPDTNTVTELSQFKQYKKVILSIARVFPPKKTDLFVEVARLLPEYGFVWIGNQREVTEFGELPTNCHFVGNMSNAGAYCSYADLFMLPSNYEGLPMVILEAMCFGKPVVASDVGGISEIVRNGENGFALKNDAVLFAGKIRYILNNEDVYLKYSKKASEIFEEELTVEKMVGGYMKIYEKIYSDNFNCNLKNEKK